MSLSRRYVIRPDLKPKRMPVPCHIVEREDGSAVLCFVDPLIRYASLDELLSTWRLTRDDLINRP